MFFFEFSFISNEKKRFRTNVVELLIAVSFVTDSSGFSQLQNDVSKKFENIFSLEKAGVELTPKPSKTRRIPSTIFFTTSENVGCDGLGLISISYTITHHFSPDH